jgi:hypothetical protein
MTNSEIETAAAEILEAWTNEAPRPKPKPKSVDPYLRGNPTRIAAFGGAGQPILPAADFDAWQSRIAERQGKLEAIMNTACGVHRFENEMLRQEERTREWVAAQLWLGLGPESIAPQTDWDLDEVAALARELGL